MLKEVNVVDILPLPENEKDRNSSSTVATEGECLSPYLFHRVNLNMTRSYDERILLFKTPKSEDPTYHKLIEKAIHWIQLTGYARNLSFETIVLCISLFYASTNYIPITKKCLEPVLCACLFIACKMDRNSQISMEELLAIVDNRQTQKSILEHQQKILSFLDFNLHFRFPLLERLSREDISTQQQYKAQFVTELLLLKQSHVLYDMEKIEQVFHFILCQGTEGLGEFKTKIKKTLKKTNSCQHLINKYKSYFDVSSFISQIDHIYIHI